MTDMAAIGSAGITPGNSFILRPGVRSPDWSFITRGAAKAALEANYRVADRKQRWVGLHPAEDRVWQAVLLSFRSSGQTLTATQIAEVTNLNLATIMAWLQKLRERDLVVVDADGAVTAAYPFCTWETGHRVRFPDGVVVRSLCALDALGAGAMLNESTIIESSCFECGAPVRITTCDRGFMVDTVSPTEAVVWSGVRYAGGCAATSGCSVKVFFCSNEHLGSWRERVDPQGAGYRLTIEEAAQVGKATFVPMLTNPGEATVSVDRQ
jgi:hypothetical protein